MPTILQLRRGTTTEHASFTGSEGEVTVNTTKDTLVVHDGSTAGGFEIALADGTNVSVSTEQVQDAAATMFTTATHTNITATYDDSANTLTLAGAAAYGDSDVGTYLSGNDYATKTATIAAITDSAPATLDTLNELAAALGDDANFASTVTDSLGNKADTSSLSTVATSGAYSDVTGTPTLATVATSGAYSDVTGTPSLSTVATSGAYSDLSGKPDIPAAYGDADARGAISVSGDLAYNSSTGVVSYTTPTERTDAEVQGLITGGTGIDVSSGVVSVDSTIATKTYADSAASTAVADVIDSSPAALDTLNELAAALGDDADFSTTVTNSIATKLASSAVSAYGLTLIDDADAATARATLGLGSAATTAASAYATAAQGTTADSAVQNLADLSITSTAAEINKLDGYTGSVTELNYLDALHATGVTSTEFDYLDGVTSAIQTQIDANRIDIFDASGTLLN